MHVCIASPAQRQSQRSRADETSDKHRLFLSVDSETFQLRQADAEISTSSPGLSVSQPTDETERPLPYAVEVIHDVPP